MKEIKNVIKHSSVIAMSNNDISLLQRKLFNFLVADAFVFLDEKEVFEVPISALTYYLWFNSNNLKYLKQCMRELIWVVVEFNILWKDKDPWEASSLLSSVAFKKWICHYSFSPILREKLHQPNIYSKIQLNLVKMFRSKYALTIYELFVDYQKIKKTPMISLKDLKLLLWTKDKYPEFKRFNSRIIIPSLKEINSIAWFKAECEYKKENKRVVAIKFIFSEIPIERKSKKEIEKIEANIELQKILITKFGLTLRQANSVLKKYPIPYIRDSLDVVEIRRREQHVKNIPAYTLTVLKNDYAEFKPRELPLSLSQTWEQETKKASISWADDKIWLGSSKNISKASLLSGDELSSHLQDKEVSGPKNKKLQQKAREYFQNLSEEKQEKLIRQFEEKKITSPILKELYQKDGIKSPLFRVMFEGWIANSTRHHLSD